MNRTLAILIASTALCAAQPTYWFRGFERQPGMEQAQQYMLKFACLSLTNGNHVTLPGADTYTTVTNWNYYATNGFTCNPAEGYITNLNSAFYRISFSVSGYGATGDELEADLCTNGVPTDFIAVHFSSGTVNKNDNAAANGILYLARGTTMCLKVKNVDTTTLTITHAQLTIGSP